MTVFDRGGFSDRAKQDKLKTPVLRNADWRDGFDNGYKAAVDRYIELNKPPSKKGGKA